MGVSLCLALLADQGEEGNKEEGKGLRSRGPSVRGSGGGGAVAGAPPRGQPQRAGTLIVPGKHEDNFGQTECTENWILQPLTLLLGPL